MEACPRLPMLSVELKNSPANAEFGPPLKKYIAIYYNENPENYAKEIKEIESLRMSACKVPRDFTGIRILKRYYAQLLCLESRFPMAEEGEASVAFVWSDIYSGMVFNITDIRYEEACILYNIGALHSELGTSDKRSNPEGMKVACTHFQCAAWAFQHLRDNFPQPKGSDMSQDLLSCFITLMLAQSQECILEKSMLDSRKSTITAKVAAQVVEFYKSTLNVLLLGSSTSEPGCILDIMKPKMFKHIEKYIEFKIAYYTSIAHLYMGNQAEEQQLMGERVAWYQSALEKHDEAVKLSKFVDKDEVQEALTFTLDVIGGKCNAAKKENEFVYHEKVLPPDALPEIKGASLVKGVPFSPHDPEVCGPDIFARLVPMETHEASSLYSEEKAKLLREVSAKIDQKNEELATFLSSVQLDRNSLVPKTDQIPDELIEMCAALSVKPNAISDMKSALNALTEVCQEVESSVNEAKALLLRDEEREKQHQEMFGKRAPNLITVELAKELSKFEMAHKKAMESNATLQRALEIHLADIQILQSPLPELQKIIPSFSIEDIPHAAEVVRELQLLFDKIEEMRGQRQMLEGQLREEIQNDDITKLLVTRDKKDSLQKIFSDQLKKHDAILGYLEQNLNAQDNIFRALINAISRYAETRKIITKTMAEREILIENLMKSYDAYDDLVLKTQKGIDFYRKLQTNVQRLQARVKSVTSVQEEERSQISHAHSKKVSKQSNIPSPSLSSTVPSSATPKLKDYLPFMTSRLGSNVPTPNVATQPTSSWAGSGIGSGGNAEISSNSSLPSPISSNLLASGASSSYPSSTPDTVPMGVRPTPVGSEQTNTGSCSSSVYSGASGLTKYGESVAKNYYSQYGYSGDASYASQSQNQQVSSAYSYNYNDTTPSPSATAATPQSSYYQTPVSQYYAPTSTPQVYASVGGSMPDSYYHYSTSYASTNQYKPLPTSVISSSYSSPQVSAIPQQSYNYQQQTSSDVSAAATYVTSNVAGGTYPAATGVYRNYYGSGSQDGGVVVSQTGSTPVAATYQQYSSASYTPTGTQDGGVVISQAGNTPVAATYQQYSSAGYTPTGTQDGGVVISQAGNTLVAATYQQYSSAGYTPTGTQDGGVVISQAGNTPVAATYQQYSSASYTPTVTTVASSQPVVDHQNQCYNTASSYGSAQVYGYNNTPNQAYSGNVNSQQQEPQSYQATYQNVDNASVQYQQPTQYGYSQEQKVHPSQDYSTQTGYNQQPTNVNQNYGTQVVPPTTTQSYQSDLSGLLPLQPTKTPQPSLPTSFQESNVSVLTANILPQTNVAKGGSSAESHSSVSSGPSSVTSSPARVSSNSQGVKKDIFESLSTDIPDESVRPVLLPKVVPLAEIQASKEKPDVDSQASYLKDPLSDKNILEKFVIEVDKFKKVVEGLTKKSLNGPTPLDQKWKEVTDAQDKESRKLSISVARCYPLKNRVPDIMPYDSNRVEIQSLRDDYINASFINGLSPTSPRFIVTQAPLPSTFTDFWVMLWEQQAEVAVCLISNAELKGHIYWPTERGQPLNYGPLSINLQNFKECQYFNEFMLNVTHNDTKISRVVIFLQFFSWPPGAVPSNPAIVLQFISEVHNYHRQQRNLQRPIVVHCTSGVGRSGVFCLLSAAMKELSLGGIIPDLSLMAIKANQQRKFLIQEKDQLKFSHEAALYYAQDILVKRGILSNKTTFDEKIPKIRTHTRHPSEDFILGGIKIEKSSSLDSKGESDTDSKSGSTLALTDDKPIETSMTEMSLKDTIPIPEPEPRPSSCPVNRTDEVSNSRNASRRSSAVSQSNSVTSILDPLNFTLDSGLQGKKKFTRDSFKNPLGLSQQNPTSSNDPLSQLDPLWSLKKE